MGLLIVAERPAQVGDRARQRRVGNEAPLPHGIDDLVLRNHPAAFRRQEGEKIHHLRFEMTDASSLTDDVEARLHEPAAKVEIGR